MVRENKDLLVVNQERRINIVKLIRGFIKENIFYSKYNEPNSSKIIASKNKDIVDYESLNSAYNPLYPDAGKIVKIPENYLYKNDRHHLKDFVIIDGKEDKNGNQVIIGFLGTSQNNKKTRQLTTENSNELRAITKVVLDKNRYHKLIKKSKTSLSQKELSEIQLLEIKEQSKTKANVNKSKRFRQ